ncbi:hypothetical protein HID58_063753 [Brassica napus]|uniref:Uncharacterized protein n=1 Tax=Brassica napus TaxID=3708 RepID=A0ABQ7Z806_BRANA|nr:hypothetical protein HID58_063753 [Brassica napus]
MDPIKCLPFRRVVVFRFHPTDQELLLGYLQPFLEGKPLLMNKIHQQNVPKQHFNFFNGKLVNGKPPKDGKTTFHLLQGWAVWFLVY